LGVAVLTTGGSQSVYGQVSWQRQAFGQVFPYPCPGAEPGQTYQWPNNNNWSQDKELTCCTTSDPCNSMQYESQPSNWNTPNYPTSGDVVIGGNGGSTNCDVNVALNNLTVTSEGALNMQYGSRILANVFNFQGNNDANAVLSVNGGSGPHPVLVIPAGGTMMKSTGNGTYQLDAAIRIEALNGGTISCDNGALQLPEAQSYYVGPLQPVITPMQFNAATGALIDLAPATSVDASTVRFTGYITGMNAGGTVRLNKGWITTLPETSGAIFNFAGNTFQWQGGSINSTMAHPFVNAGTINVTAGTPNPGGNGFIN